MAQIRLNKSYDDIDALFTGTSGMQQLGRYWQGVSDLEGRILCKLNTSGETFLQSGFDDSKLPDYFAERIKAAEIEAVERSGVYTFMGRIVDQDLTAPPATDPADGAKYIVGAGATGLWATHAGDIATFNEDGVGAGTDYDSGPPVVEAVEPAWTFETPTANDVVAMLDEGVYYYYTGAAWATLADEVFLYSMLHGSATYARLATNVFTSPIPLQITFEFDENGNYGWRIVGQTPDGAEEYWVYFVERIIHDTETDGVAYDNDPPSPVY